MLNEKPANPINFDDVGNDYNRLRVPSSADEKEDDVIGDVSPGNSVGGGGNKYDSTETGKLIMFLEVFFKDEQGLSIPVTLKDGFYADITFKLDGSDLTPLI